MRNIEIKATLRDPDSVKAYAEKLSGSKPTVIEHDDNFYSVPNGRLKLRAFSESCAELIHYKRPDIKGPKLSTYTKTSFTGKSTCEALHNILSDANGQLGRVKKTRLLYIVGQARIHIDQVLNLGDFMEIEVVLEDHQDIQVGEQIVDDLMKTLNITKNDLISEAYIDLINNLKF